MPINRTRRAGFTLPEVLVTVAIVAILAASIIPSVRLARRHAAASQP